MNHNERIHLNKLCICKFNKPKSDQIEKSIVDSILEQISKFYNTLEHKPMHIKKVFASKNELKS